MTRHPWLVCLLVIVSTLGLYLYASLWLAESSWPKPAGDPDGWHACTQSLVDTAPRPADCLSDVPPKG